jgi:preprotein translocase subunit SecA
MGKEDNLNKNIKTLNKELNEFMLKALKDVFLFSWIKANQSQAYETNIKNFSYGHNKAVAIDKAKQACAELFYKVWTDENENWCTTLISKCDTKKLIDDFIQHHSWLEEELSHESKSLEIKKTITYAFLSTHLENQVLVHMLPIDTLEDKDGLFLWSDVESLLSNKKECKPHNDAATKKAIKHFPFDNIFKYLEINTVNIDNKHFSLLPCLDQHLKNYKELYTNKPNLLDFPFTQTDLYYFLINNYSSHIQPKSTPSIALYTIEQFESLDKEDLEQLKVALLNMGTDEKPLWICLQNQTKEQDTAAIQWNAYIPKHQEEAFKNISFNKIEHSEFKKTLVDYSINQKQCNIEGLSDNTFWMAVLMERVLPFCLQSEVGDLNEYRHNIPITVLLEETLSSCLPEPYNYHVNIKNDDRYYRALALKEGFWARYPYSEHPFEKAFNNRVNNTVKTGELLNKYYDNSLMTCPKMMEYFNSELYQLASLKENELPNKLIINTNKYGDVIPALWLIYQNQNLTSLKMNDLATSGYAKDESRVIRLFKHNPTLQSVIPNNVLLKDRSLLKEIFPHLARNRFIKTFNTNDITKDKDDYELWELVTTPLLNLIQSPWHESIKDISQLSTNSKKWRSEYFEHEPKANATEWQLAQMTHMGAKGLDLIFSYIDEAFIEKWNPDIQEPAPNLNGYFDLSGEIGQLPNRYISSLTKKITSFQKNNGCGPLFKSLFLDMPSEDNFSIIKSSSSQYKYKFEHEGFYLKELFTTLNNLKIQNPADLNEINLLGVDIKAAAYNHYMLDWMLEQANDKNTPLRLMIRIPEWDKNVYVDDKERPLKNKYKALQNKILENQRVARQEDLKYNTQSIYECDNLKPDIAITQNNFVQQDWHGVEDFEYPLVSEGGMQLEFKQQQEQQQEMVVDHKHEVKKEEQQKQQQEEQVLVMLPYEGEGTELITRKTIDVRCRKQWDSLDKNKQRHSGIKEDDTLDALFSLWVGSDKDASEVIESIHPDAFNAILKNPSLYQFGISKDNLAPGFSLKTKNGKLILCFDELQEKKDLLSHAQDLKRYTYSAFTVIPYEPIQAQVFCGDYRQLQPIETEKDFNKEPSTAWEFLATEDKDSVRLNNEVTTYNQLNVYGKSHDFETISTLEFKEISNAIQFFTVQGTDTKINNYKAQAMLTCRQQLINWVKTFDKTDYSNIINLFNKEENFSALGQLFYTHGSDGIKHFLALGQEINKAFGKKGLNAWKKAIIDSSQNLNECLLKEEVDAVSMSIATLKDNKAALAIWFALIKAHVRTTGHMRYSHLWNSYQQFLKLIHDERIDLNSEEMQKYLNNASHFNGQVFLERLHRVLSNTSSIGRKDVQQNILDNVSNIDWRHNGYYYAVQYEGYRYYDASLNLKEWQSSNQKDDPNYLPELDSFKKQTPQQFIDNTRRYIARIMQYSQTQYQQLNHLIHECFIETKFLEQEALGIQSLRALIICLAIGREPIPDANELKQQLETFKKINPKLLAWFNDAIALDKGIQSGTLGLKLSQIARLLEAVHDSDLVDDVLKMNPTESRAFINATARALDCYNKQEIKKVSLTHLLQFTKSDFNHTLLTTMPWIFLELGAQHDTWQDPLASFKKNPTEDKNAELLKLTQQLQSIRFNQSTSLPTQKELHDLINQMSENNLEEQALLRQAFIEANLQKGCAFTQLDTRYRVLTKEEIGTTYQYVEKNARECSQEDNLKLLNRFLQSHIAVSTEVGLLQQTKNIDALRNILLLTDNKNHVNQMGLLLGTLIGFAQKNNKRYSAEQLTLWLSSFIGKKSGDEDYIPLKLITELLNHEDTLLDSSLLNTELYYLQQQPQEDILKSIQSVISATIPNQYKAALITIALKKVEFSFVFQSTRVLTALTKHQKNNKWIKAVEGLIVQMSQNTKHQLYQDKIYISMLNEVSLVLDKDLSSNKKLNTCWEQAQIKFAKIYQNNYEHLDKKMVALFDIDKEQSQRSMLARMIMLQACDKKTPIKDQVKLLQELQIKLLDKQRLPQNELVQLAEYCVDDPIPTLNELNTLLSDKKEHNTSEIIHHFESVMQASVSDGQSKRHYDVTEDERKNITRIISNIKLKGYENGPLEDKEQKQVTELLFFMNGFAQYAALDNLSMTHLQEQLEHYRQLTLNNTDINKVHSSICLLAIMREIALRKTGKWLNHTQSVVLIFAALHQEDGLLHRVKTGEGKTLITSVRVAFSALLGDIVAAYSSSDVLVYRDWLQATPFLDALGINHSYITPQSETSSFHKGDDIKKKGAVLYTTSANLSLFEFAQIWEHRQDVSVEKNRYREFYDEIDNALLDTSDTQYNFSTGSKTGSFNYDKWVYSVVYKYFLDHIHLKNKKSITTLIDLKALSVALIKASRNAPKQSTFIQDFFLNKEKLSKKETAYRNKKLKQLLLAAFKAHHFKVDKDYCIVKDTLDIGGGNIIDALSVRVLSDSQIVPGVTYSEDVHQVLCHINNLKLIEQGLAPLFDIPPTTQIALSNNLENHAKTRSKVEEGCTGTAGGDKDANRFKKYGISHILNYETHKPSQTEFLGNEYCDGIEAQVDQIVIRILEHTKSSTVITCSDDEQVKILGKLIKKKLEECSKFDTTNNFIEYTNDKGISQKTIIKKAQKAGMVIIGASIGRGTDFDPENKKLGTQVIDTEPAKYTIQKQREGRQGRQGNPGRYTKIINAKKIDEDYDYYSSSSYKDRLDKLYQEQAQRVQKKLVESDKQEWLWLKKNTRAQGYYIKSQAIETLKEWIKKDKNKYTKYKNILFNTLSTNIEQTLKSYLNTSHRFDSLSEEWLLLKDEIDTLWNTPINGKSINDEKTLMTFYIAADGLWRGLCNDYGALDKEVITHLQDEYTKQQQIKEQNNVKKEDKIVVPNEEEKIKRVLDKKNQLEVQQKSLNTAISFYQKWISGAQDYYFAEEPIDKDKTQIIYGKDHTGLNRLFSAINLLSLNKHQYNETIFTALNDVKDPLLHLISTEVLAEIIEFLNENQNKKHSQDYIKQFSQFFNNKELEGKTPKNTSAEDIKKYGHLLKLQIKIANSEYVINEDKNTAALIERVTFLVLTRYWNDFDDKLVSALESVFAGSPSVTKILASNYLQFDCDKLIELINGAKNNSERINQFTDYMNDQHKFITEDYLGLVSFVAKIALSGAQSDEELSFIPKHQGEFLGRARTIAWFNFLEHRRPIIKGDEEALENLLKQHINDEDFDTQLFKPLMDIPPYIPIGTILSHTKDNFNQSQLEKIKKAGARFVAFAYQNGLIPSPYQFVSDNKNTIRESLLAEFELMTPEQNSAFFEALTKKNHRGTLNKVILSLAKGFRQGRTIKDVSRLTTLLGWVEKMNALSQPSQDDLIHEFCGVLEEKENATSVYSFIHTNSIHDIHSEPLGQFCQSWLNNKVNYLDTHTKGLLRTQKLSLCKDEYLTQLYSELLTDKITEDSVLKSLMLFEKINAFQTKYPNIPCFETFLGEQQKTADVIDYYNHFLVEVAQLGDYPKESMKELFNHCFKHKILIKTKADLDVAIQAILLAQQLHTKGGWSDYFSSVFCKNYEARLPVLKILYFNLLHHLGKSFAALCYKHLHNLAGTLSVPVLTGLSAKARKDTLSHAFHAVRYFTDELRCLSKHDEPLTMNATREDHLKHIQLKKEEYDTVWWTALSGRAKTAQSFFTDLKGKANNKELSDVDYLQASLAVIRNTQKEIECADRKWYWNRNTKGYSRLEHISRELELNMIKSYLEATHLGQKDINWLKSHINYQLKYQLASLKIRLNDKKHKPLKDLLTGSHPDLLKDEDVGKGVILNMKLMTDLRNYEWECLPSELQYIVTNIRCFMDIDDQLPKEDKPLNYK